MAERDTRYDPVIEAFLAAIRRIEARDPELVRRWAEAASTPLSQEERLAAIEALYPSPPPRPCRRRSRVQKDAQDASDQNADVRV